METFLGIMIPFLGTALGAACVFFMKKSLGDLVQRALAGFAAGVMVAASIWSLLIPAIEQSEGMGKLSFLPAFIGFWVGVLFLLLLDRLIPHLHVGSEQAEGPKSRLGRTTMMVLAVTLHNIPEGMAVGAVNGGGIPIVFPPSADASTILPAEPEQGTGSATLGYTPVTSDLYYSGGYLGTLKIPSIDLSVRVYEGTDSSTLAKGAGHFEGTSIWNGNVSIAGHNRGVRDDFGDLHTLERGDTVTWITKLGTRTYEVTSVEKVRETNTSGTAPSAENMLTLYTCVRNQREYRWQVRAVEVV